MQDDSSFWVIVRPETLKRSPRDSISGVVFIKLDHRAFPEKEWSDLIVAVLRMWVESFTALLEGSMSQAELNFMDGPFLVRLTPAGPHHLTVELVEGTESEAVSGSAVVGTLAALEAVAGAVDQVLAACSSNLWWSRDIDHLVIAREALHSQVRKFGKAP
jgi:hypothetical protein